MSEAHNDYLKDDHFEDDEEELHLEPQKGTTPPLRR